MILVFFLHTCPHCHHELEFLKKELPKIPQNARPALIGVSMLDHVASVQATLQQDGLDFFPVLLDSDYKIRTAYRRSRRRTGHLLDRCGGTRRLAHDRLGNPQDEPLMRMRLAKLAWQPADAASRHRLQRQAVSSAPLCHEGPTEAWELTAHAGAFRKADREARCGSAGRGVRRLSRRRVGAKPGGDTLTPPTSELRESWAARGTCHGRGGPTEVAGAGEEPRPLLGVRDVPRRARAWLRILVFVLPPAGRLQIHRPSRRAAAGGKAQAAEANGQLREPILGNANARFVGSAACQDCHASEYAIWRRAPTLIPSNP